MGTGFAGEGSTGDMNTPTHDEIALQAAQLWKDRGCPEGIDNEIWLEAERQLQEGSQPAGGGKDQVFIERAKEETAAESMVEYNITPPVSQQAAIKAAVQNKPKNGKR